MNKKLLHQFTNIYVFMRTLKNRLFYSNASSKKVLVVIDGLIGDAVLIQDFLRECKEYFNNTGRYEIELFFSKSFVCNFFKDCCDTEGFRIIDAHYQKKEVDLKDLKQVLKVFENQEYEYILNPLPKLKGDKITGCIKGKYKLTVRDDYRIQGQIFQNLFRKIAYTSTTEVPKTMMEFQRYQKLLAMCGDETYKTKLPVLAKKGISLDLPKQKYCVLSVGASEVGKIWDLYKYSNVIDYIHERYNILTVFVGSGAGKKMVDIVCNQIKNSKLINDFTGKTSYSEWVEIIRNAVFLLGNDSASIHIAAAVNTPFLCIVGEWQYKRFYPYKTDMDGDINQVIVNCGRELYCRDCGRNVQRIKNNNCKNRLINKKSLECIELIDEQFVVNAIKNSLEPFICT